MRSERSLPRGDGGEQSEATGAATSVLLATSSRLESRSGRYFEHNNEALTVDDPVTAYARGFGVARYALDGDSARRLWEMSEAVLA